MKVVSNFEYNKYNDSNNNTILDLTGERYVFILNELLGNLENSSFVKNAFAKIDKKNESFFTKEERKIKYRESIAAAEENKKSYDDFKELPASIASLL